jgi:hypothetical protein
MKIYIGINVSDDWEDRMDMQQTLEREVKADRWSWHRAIPVAQPAEPLTEKQINEAYIEHDIRFAYVSSAWSFDAGVAFAEKHHGIKAKEKK